MSVEALHGGLEDSHGHGGHHGGHSDDAHEAYTHQFVSRAQQNECYLVGMWSFLVTEIMFFGALFLAYVVYRYKYGAVFAEVSREHLNTGLGFINTLVLLSSSFTMAMAVRAAQLKNKNHQLIFIGITCLCALGFMGVKYVEYSAKFHHELVPGAHFRYEINGMKVSAAGPSPEAVDATGTAPGNTSSLILPKSAKEADAVQTAQKAEIFLSLYFIMTGLHGIHVVLGFLMLGAMWWMIATDNPIMKDYMWVEMGGLYWHFVDIVWIFLYPVLYLIHPSWDIVKKQFGLGG